MGIADILKNSTKENQVRLIFSGENILVEEKSNVCNGCFFVNDSDFCKTKHSCQDRKVKFVVWKD